VSPYPTAGSHDRGVDGRVTILPARALDAVLAAGPQRPPATLATVSRALPRETQLDAMYWADAAEDAAAEGLEATPLPTGGNTIRPSPFEELLDRLWRP
jgi:hypothetical protein